MSDFRGKTVVVTGASRGIGEATARYLAELGATVVLAARNRDRLGAIARDIKATGGRALPMACDVSRPRDVQNLIADAVDATGRVDVLVNNAGVIDPIARLADSDPIAWGRVADINFKGVYHGLRYGIPAMLERDGGTIVNLSSGAATSALEGWSHYCGTKAAVLALTRVADKEYRDQGIRVIGLSPGTVATEMQTQIKASGINPVSRLEPDAHISADWVARAIAWLTTSAADVHRGTDFSIKTEAGRAAVGLPPAY